MHSVEPYFETSKLVLGMDREIYFNGKIMIMMWELLCDITLTSVIRVRSSSSSLRWNNTSSYWERLKLFLQDLTKEEVISGEHKIFVAHCLPPNDFALFFSFLKFVLGYQHLSLNTDFSPQQYKTWARNAWISNLYNSQIIECDILSEVKVRRWFISLSYMGSIRYIWSSQRVKQQG